MTKILHPVEPEELMAYLDGELSSDRTTIAAEHLRDCAECQTLINDLRSVSRSLRAWDVADLEPHMPSTVATALSEQTPEAERAAGSKLQPWRRFLGIRWQTAEWVGALAFIFIVVVGTVRFIGGNANSVFSQVGSAMDDADSGLDRDRIELRASKGAAPAGASTPGRQFGSIQQFAKLQKAPPIKFKEPPASQSATAREALASGPMIIRTAQLALIAKDFDNARGAVEAILKRHRGYVGELKVGGATGSGRTLTATLRIPADQLDASLTDLKALGRVESESQSGQDVTSQYVDLQARLSNARTTEQRLTDMLRQRTGKLSDVLEVEQEVDRVRGEIEQMEAERKNMSNQVSYATLNATITEDYKAQLQVVPPSTSTRLGNAAVEGYKSMVDGMLGLALFLLENIPSLLSWLALLFFPARMVWKKVRRSFAE